MLISQSWVTNLLQRGGNPDFSVSSAELDSAYVRVGFETEGYAALPEIEGPLGIGWDGPLPAFPAESRVVDTTAAGDSFNGAFLAALLAGSSPPDCLLAGHMLASRVIRYPGAIIPE